MNSLWLKINSLIQSGLGTYLHQETKMSSNLIEMLGFVGLSLGVCSSTNNIKALSKLTVA